MGGNPADLRPAAALSSGSEPYCVAPFEKDADYAAFKQVPSEAVDRTSMLLWAYCGLPNHWHLEVWPEEDG